MSQWIDFKQLREHLDFAAVLKHYGVELKLKGDQHHGFCPLPTHQGKKASPSFSANVGRKIWQCFGCQQKGNVLDFAVRMEGLDPENGADFRKVAMKLKGLFVDKTGEPEPVAEREERETPAPEESGKPAAEKSPEDKRPRIVNAVLNFELKELDASHPYLKGRGLTEKTIAHFGLGYCSRGLMKGRIAIPLRDEEGKLIGYAGRIVDDESIGPDTTKYKVPSNREHKGTVYEFHKSLFLYNGHQILKPVDDLCVVEGFPAVWWLWQAGWPNVVGLMGSSCSEAQAALIVESVTSAGRVWLMPDGDDAGGRCAESLLVRVVPHRFTRWVQLAAGKQPTDYGPEELRTLFGEGGANGRR